MSIRRDLRGLFAWFFRLPRTSRPSKVQPLSRSEIEPSCELTRNTAEGCLDRAAADLQEAEKSIDPDERKQLRWGAARLSLRADMLTRLAKSFEKRAALDEESRQYRREKERKTILP